MAASGTVLITQRSSLRSGGAELTVGSDGWQFRYKLRECMLLFSINKGGTAELINFVPCICNAGDFLFFNLVNLFEVIK